MYRDLYKSLVGDVPKLSEPKAQQLINEALRQIYDYHLWSFLLDQGFISIPNQVVAGTVAVVRGSADVVVSPTTKAILDVFGLTPPLTSCQLRVGSGPPYEINSYDDTTGTITLKRFYLEASNPTAAYAIYRAYFTPPLPTEGGEYDFVKFRFIHNRLPGYKPMNPSSQSYLSRVDPNRLSRSEPLVYAPFRSTTVNGTAIPLFEFWPHPTVERNLFSIFQRQGKKLVEDTDELPQPLTDSLVLTLARYKAYEWADSHKGEFKEQLLGVNWSRKRTEIMDLRSMDGYPQQLARAVKQDREIFLSSMLSNYYLDIYGTGYPGGNWYMNHAVAGGYSTI